jgi:hypothetical protein
MRPKLLRSVWLAMRLVESLKPGRRKPLPLGMGYITGIQYSMDGKNAPAGS